MQHMAYAIGLGEIEGSEQAAEAIAAAVIGMNHRLGLPRIS